MIVDSLALVMVGIGLTAVVAGYQRNLPDPAAQTAQAAEADLDWMDPVTTGSIAPKGKGAINKAASPAEPKTESKAWVDPPRHSDADGRPDPATDQVMELRLPRP